MARTRRGVQKVLGTRDWEAVSDRFRLCVAVLKDENPEEYLTRAVKSGDVSLSDLYEWPVFSEFRERKEFSTLVSVSQKTLVSG